MDKQKQIEEIVKFHCNELYSNGICKEDNKPCVINNGNYCAVIENAKILLDKLIPENSVVLTEEEYEGLQKGIKTYNYTAMFNSWQETRIQQLEERLCFVYEQTRKETAKKFAERLKTKLCEFFDDNEDNDGKIDKGICLIEIIGVESLDGEIISLGLIDEICKEITGVEENGET